MPRFDDDFLNGAADGMLEHYGESIIYRPRGGVSRTITAIVDRRPPGRQMADGRMLTPKAQIQVKIDAVDGILPSLINAGGNDRVRIDLKTPEGTDTTDLGLYIPEGDEAWNSGGMLTLDVM